MSEATEQKDPNADPDCAYCKGKGWSLVRIDEDDVDKDPCDCVINPKHKRFRCSIYLDVNAHTKDQAQLIVERVVSHLGDPEFQELPEGYYNPYFGGAAWLITGDLLGNHKRMEKI